MKAKRILSLLLTVAMIMTCVTAFAAAPVDGYVQTYMLGNGLDSEMRVSQAINENAVLPTLDEPRIDIVVEKKTDAEIKESMGVTASGDNVGKGYIVTATYKDLGTLYSGVDSDGFWVEGFGVTQAVLTIDSTSDYSFNNGRGDITTKGTAPFTATKSATKTFFEAVVSDESFAYPVADGTNIKAEDASFTLQFAIFAEEGTVLNIIDAVVLLENYYAKDTGEGYSLPHNGTPDGVPYDAIQVSMWHPATITLAAEEEPEEYEITFVVDGVETKVTVEEGEVPAFTGSTDKAADAQYTYTFKGWDKEIVAATENATYTAQYDKTVNKYDITFMSNGEVYETVAVEYGTVPAPTANPADYTDGKGGIKYVFTGWTPELVAVTGEATYTAVFEETLVDLDADKVDIVFNVCGKTKTVKVKIGEPIPFPETVAFPEDNVNYTFIGWTNDETAEGTPVEGQVLATVNDTYYAMFTSEWKTPVFNMTVGADNGVQGATALYDNAYATEVTFNNINGATRYGVLFIPEAVLEKAGEEVFAYGNALVADAGVDANVHGGGTAVLKAAIAKIPYKYSTEKKPEGIKLVTKAYVVRGGAVYYSDPKTVTLKFTKTDEPTTTPAE